MSGHKLLSQSMPSVSDAVKKQKHEKPKSTNKSKLGLAESLSDLKIPRSAEEEKQVRMLLDGKTTCLPFAVNALQVVARRYLMRSLDGEKVIETPEQMMERVATALASVESRYGSTEVEIDTFARRFFDEMASMRFTPAGRTLANAGGPTRLVANCIVLHIEDSMDHIFQTLSDAALLQQAGSGLGFPLHLLRPAGMATLRSRGQASGPVSFLHIYNTAFGVIKQQNRHGANMAVMSVDHPDILEFIHCKDVEGDLKNFNVSVGLTDRFMAQVASNDQRPWTCHFNGKEYKPREISRDRNFSLLGVKDVNITARDIFMQIVDSAWRTGEPGCVFLDTVNAANPLPGLGRIEACNPCGEQFLHDGDVCNLGSINLEKFVVNGDVDYDQLTRTSMTAVRMLDNVIDLSDFPVDRVNSTSKNNRRIGLGIMGFADMLYQLGVGYDSAEGRDVARRVMKCIQKAAERQSELLAEQKGCFANWDKSVFAATNTKRRNAALTNIAPTGTIAMSYNVSGGVEPYFALAYHYRGILGGDVRLEYFNKHLAAALKKANCFTPEIVSRIHTEGSVQRIEELPESIRRTFVTSMDITARNHILMQSAMQEHCDNAISKTINFANSATRQDILEGYITAWQHKCKGCTVYRDGSRVFQILNLNESGDKAKQDNEASSSSSSSSNAVVPIVDDDDSENTPINSDNITVELDVSMSSKKRVSPDSASNVDPGLGKKQRVFAAAAIDKAVAEASSSSSAIADKSQCPDCSDKLVFQEGCCTCMNCGFSMCSRA